MSLQPCAFFRGQGQGWRRCLIVGLLAEHPLAGDLLDALFADLLQCLVENVAQQRSVVAHADGEPGAPLAEAAVYAQIRQLFPVDQVKGHHPVAGIGIGVTT